MIRRLSISRLIARVATSLGDWRLRGWSAAMFICVLFGIAFAVRWFLLGELSARLLFPSFLLAVYISTWVVGVRAGVLGAAITLLTGTIVYSQDSAGLTSRDLYSLGFVLTLCSIGLAIVAKARRNRDQLRAGRRWYGSLLDHSTEAICFVADDGSLRYLNRSARKLWNVDESVIGRAASVALPMQREGLPFSFNVASNGPMAYGKRKPLPLGLLALHGTEWVPVTGCATWVDDPAYGKGLVFSLQWDEALREATTELAVTRHQLDALLEANVVGVAALQKDGRLKYPNDALLTMIGIQGGSAGAAELVLPDLLVDPAVEARIGPLACDAELRRADGGSLWVSLSLATTGGGESLLLATRIDDRKQAEKQARFRRLLLQSIIDDVPAYIAFLRPAGHVEVANRLALPLTGEAQEHGQGGRVLSPGFLDQIDAALVAAWQGVESRVMVNIGASDSPLHLQTQLTPYRGDTGEVEGVVLHAFDVTERLQRERQLIESEYRFRRLADAFAAVVWQSTEDGRLLSEFGWNAFTGTESGSSIADWACAVHPDDLHLLQQFLSAMPGATSRHDVELRIAHRDGGFRHVALKGIPLDYHEQPPRQWIGCIRDINARKTFAAALSASEAQLRLILESVPVRLAYVNAENVLQWANRSFAEWTGFEGDARGLGINTVLGADITATLSSALSEAHRGQTASLEWSHSHPELGVRWSNSTFIPDIDDDGSVRGVITLCVDCTERHDREAMLKRNVAQHQALVENVPHMVWISAPDGAVEYFNHRWHEFTLLVGCGSWIDATHPDDRAAAADRHGDALREGVEFSHEVRFRRGHDGQFRWHLVKAIPLRTEDGSIIRWYGTATDIEDQKVAQVTLQETQARTDRFLATLSHELRNPLAALVSSSEVLDHTSATRRHRRDASVTIRRQAAHLKRLVDDLLDISRITAGKIQLSPQTFDIASLCRNACSDFSSLASRRSVELHCETPDPPLWVWGDPARIRQCVDNLVSNAIKASSPEGKVFIRVQLRVRSVEIEVEDEGIGISASLLPGIFQPFTQGEGWTQNGLGLGLNIVQRMVELHGGEVRAHSAGAGCGSRFSIALPRSPQSEPPAPLPAQRPLDGSTAGAGPTGSVIIVDDEQDNARALGYLLELAGNTVHCAADGPEALGLARRIKPDVVICDIGLPPPVSGLQVAGRLRESATWPLYLIAYSGYGTQSDIERSRTAGFDVHLTKPCSPAVILAEIKKGLEQCARQVVD